MKMRKFPLEDGREYLLLVKHEDETKSKIIGTWDGYYFCSLTDSNDDDYLRKCVVLEYLPL